MTTSPSIHDLMGECEVEAIERGHRATFRGVPATFVCSTGPSAWTERMARQGAVFFAALREKERFENPPGRVRAPGAGGFDGRGEL